MYTVISAAWRSAFSGKSVLYCSTTARLATMDDNISTSFSWYSTNLMLAERTQVTPPKMSEAGEGPSWLRLVPIGAYRFTNSKRGRSHFAALMDLLFFTFSPIAASMAVAYWSRVGFPGLLVFKKESSSSFVSFPTSVLQAPMASLSL